MRMGKTKQPTYRVVAADSRSPRNGRFIEIVGTYEPRQDPSRIVIDNDKAVAWLRKGAHPPDRVQRTPQQAVGGRGGGGERGARAALAAQRRDLETLRQSHARHARWLEAIALLAEALQREPEPAAAVRQSLDGLIRHTGGGDAALATHGAGRLAIERSHRGMFGPTAVTVAAHPQL